MSHADKQIGMHSDQRVGFFGAEPQPQQAAIPDLDAGATLADVITKVNTVLAALRSMGLIAEE